MTLSRLKIDFLGTQRWTFADMARRDWTFPDVARLGARGRLAGFRVWSENVQFYLWKRL